MRRALRKIPERKTSITEKLSETAVFTEPKRKRRVCESGGEGVLPAVKPRVLENSLDVMNASDIPEANNKKKINTFEIIRYIILTVCICVFIYSSFSLVERFYYYIKGGKDYEHISEVFEESDRFVLSYMDKSSQNVTSNMILESLGGAVAPEIEETDIILTDQEKLLFAKFEKLRKINSDICGWITIDGTKINYPVLRGLDNDHYLQFNYIGDYNPGGSIFMDYRNSKKISSNLHTVIYGHNMRDGSMLAQLHNYENEDLFQKGYVKIMTTEGTFTYRMFSVHQPHETVHYFRTSFTDEQDYYDFILGLQGMSKYKTDVVLKPTDKVLTLSTCVDAVVSSEYRFVVHAVLVSVEK